MPGGRPKEKYSQALRLLKIWEMLHNRRAMTIAELAGEFGIDRRTVHRDISVLKEHYALDEEWSPTGEKTFSLMPTARLETLSLTVAEMIALYMGRNLFAFTKGTHLAGAMESLYKKLQTKLDRRDVQVRERLPKKLYCTTGFPKTYTGSDDALNDVLTGIIKEQKVQLRYRPPTGGLFDVVIHPYTLVAHNHALYVIGFSEYAKDRRTFALERITRSQRLHEGFVYPAKYDPAAVFNQAFGITSGGAVQRIRLLFSPRVAPYAGSRQWHASMKTKPRRSGGLEMTLDVAVGEELLHWITGYGDGVRVLGPPALRDEVRTRHEAAVR